MRPAAGQERKEVPFAEHTACTIEMTNLNKRVDVAVIDEIQVGCSRSSPTLQPLHAVPLGPQAQASQAAEGFLPCC
jgi:hypothetical protein